MLLLIKKKEKKALCCDIHSQQRQKGSPYLIKGLLGRFLEFLKGQKEKTQVPDGVFFSGTAPHSGNAGEWWDIRMGFIFVFEVNWILERSRSTKKLPTLQMSFFTSPRIHMLRNKNSKIVILTIKKKSPPKKTTKNNTKHNFFFIF